MSCRSNDKHFCRDSHAQSLCRGHPYLITNELGAFKNGPHSINADEVTALREAVNMTDDMIKATCAENILRH
jgi:hypothetical protein